jgi:hypothetical protein
MQMTLEQADERLATLRQQMLRLEGYIQALREMALDREAEQSAPEPTPLKKVQ